MDTARDGTGGRLEGTGRQQVAQIVGVQYWRDSQVSASNLQGGALLRAEEGGEEGCGSESLAGSTASHGACFMAE